MDEFKKLFYDYLSEQFTDRVSARKWIRYWYKDLNQYCPHGLFSIRAMAGHIHNVLNNTEEGADFFYEETDYDLYFAAQLGDWNGSKPKAGV